MEISIPFAEITKYLTSHYNQEIIFSYVSEREFQLTYKKKVLVVNVDAKVNLTIKTIKPASVSFVYGSNFVVEGVISKAVDFIKLKYPSIGMGITKEDGNTVTIDLSKISDAKPIIENFDLRTLSFTPTSLKITATLK